jgi:hypothetical protein
MTSKMENRYEDLKRSILDVEFQAQLLDELVPENLE